MRKDARVDKIHISEIDEYLAARILEKSGESLGILVKKSGDEGHITITDTQETRTLQNHAIDFELSPSEYLNLDEAALDELFTTPLITSSALEFFDYLLLRFSSFSCFLEFTGNAWKVKVIEFAK